MPNTAPPLYASFTLFCEDRVYAGPGAPAHAVLGEFRRWSALNGRQAPTNVPEILALLAFAGMPVQTRPRDRGHGVLHYVPGISIART